MIFELAEYCHNYFLKIIKNEFYDRFLTPGCYS